MFTSGRSRHRSTACVVMTSVSLLVASCTATKADPAAGVTTTRSSATGSAAPAGTASDVDRVLEITTADGMRTALIHHPPTAKPGASLVVVLHPAATSASTTEAAFGWDRIADRDGLVVAYPEGLLDSLQDTWNGGKCCPPASQLHTDDVGFLDTVVAAVRQYDGVGATVYAVGFSNGAVMAYAWACARPGLAGLGIVAGAVMADCAHPAATTVIAVHGTADTSIPISGGTGPGNITFPSLAASLAPFESANGCPTSPGKIVRNGAATTSTWECRGGRQVVTDVVSGLGHAWPGAGAGSGTTTGPRDATGFLWSHLHPTKG